MGRLVVRMWCGLIRRVYDRREVGHVEVHVYIADRLY
jgi:hypothetical protein